jgi:hypothetical protein
MNELINYIEVIKIGLAIHTEDLEILWKVFQNYIICLSQLTGIET